MIPGLDRLQAAHRQPCNYSLLRLLADVIARLDKRNDVMKQLFVDRPLVAHQDSSDGVTAVNADGSAGDEIGSSRSQKDSGSRAFIGITKTAGWRACYDFLV